MDDDAPVDLVHPSRIVRGDDDEPLLHPFSAAAGNGTEEEQGEQGEREEREEQEEREERDEEQREEHQEIPWCSVLPDSRHQLLEAIQSKGRSLHTSRKNTA